MTSKQFITDALNYHNTRRSEHGVPPLTHNPAVSDRAQKWADHLARTNTFQHCQDRNFQGQTMGENIAMNFTSGGEEFTGQQATDQWYSEVLKFDFNRGVGGGHFSQVVWKASKEFGIGRAKTRDGKWIVVGNYVPAGNMAGQAKANVFPPTRGMASVKLPEKESPKPLSFGGGGQPTTFGSGQPITFGSGQRTTFGSGPPTRIIQSTGPTQSSSVSSRTMTSGGVTKTIITETTIGPDGTKRTVTRETVKS
eukprot:GHVU01032389.1.p1 GENE.GHVU01032389.1~~GHVU01032389.1.p1  ORF type:complete len:252 (-),score=26.08 GHVU01032389.1:2309-3064(-)